MKNITILIPGIRTPNWKNLLESLKQTCKRYSYDVLFTSPFDIPREIKERDNIKLIKSYATIPVCVQQSVLEIDSELFFLTVDDCVFAEDALDEALDLYHDRCSEKDIISALYGEGGNKMEQKYWLVNTHQDLRLPGIPKGFALANQPIMRKELFIESGGFDCETFRYMDKPIHDLMFRLQYNGSKIFHSPKHICIAEWLNGHDGDHMPVHEDQVNHDTPIFNSLYSDPNLLEEREISYDNWKSAPQIWERRFGPDPDKLPKTYEELCIINNYKFEKKVKEG